MPRTSIIAVAAAIVAVLIPASGAAEAAGGDRSGGGRAPAVAYGDDRGDPYAYRYQPRAYYPYYGSPYWRPAAEMLLYRDRYRHELPRYYPAWGYPQPLPAVPRRRHGGQ
jgi:hypothetical protein